MKEVTEEVIEIETLHVDRKGEICIKCLPCQKSKMIEAPEGRREITTVCRGCGKKTSFKINWRLRGFRKRYEERMKIGDAQVLTCDLSLSGISFEGGKLDIPLKSRVKIELPLTMIPRDVFSQTLLVEIVSNHGGRYGARFIDLQEGSKAKKCIYTWLMEP